MRLRTFQGLISLCLLASAPSLSGCASAGIEIPDSLKAECESTFDATGAATLADVSRGIIIGDADLRVCSLKKDAVVAIAESGNRRWWEFWR